MTRERGVGRLFWWAGWPFRMTLLVIFRGYQKLISPLTPPSCRYHPCCSSYGVRAVRRHGAAKGLVLTGARLVRCNPWTKGGVDPVPQLGRWRPDVLPDGTPRYGETLAADEPGRAVTRDPRGTEHQSLSGSGA